MTGYYLSKYEARLSQLNRVELIITRLSGIVGNLILTKFRLIFVPIIEIIKSEEKDYISALSLEYLEIPISSIYDIIIVGRSDLRSYITSKKIYNKESIQIIGKNSRVHFFKPEINKAAEAKAFLDFLTSFLIIPTKIPAKISAEIPAKISNGSTTQFYLGSLANSQKDPPKESPSITIQENNKRFSKSYVNPFVSFKMEGLSLKYDPYYSYSEDRQEIIIPSPLNNIRYNVNDETSQEGPLIKINAEEAWNEHLLKSGGDLYFSISDEISSPRLKEYSCNITPKNKSIDWGKINNHFVDKRGPIFSCFFKKYETVLYSSGNIINRDNIQQLEQPITKCVELKDLSSFSDILLQSLLPMDLINRKIVFIDAEMILQKSHVITKSYKEICKLCTSIGCKKIGDKLKNKKKILDPTMNQSGIITKYTTKTFFSKLQYTDWYTLVSKILKMSADILHIYKSCNVIISDKEYHYSSILISLVKIMVEPFYRSPVGFWYLIYQEWLTNGYDFAQCLGECNKFTKSIDALFFLFLDCVHQLWNQFPRYFKFNENFLVVVSDAVLSGIFKSFENKNKHLDANYIHLDVFDYNAFWEKYSNPLYHITKLLSYELHDIDCLVPITFQSGLVLWGDFFLRYTQGYSQIKYDWKGHNSIMVKYVEDILNASSKHSKKETRICYTDFRYDIPLTFINDILFHAESTPTPSP